MSCPQVRLRESNFGTGCEIPLMITDDPDVLLKVQHNMLDYEGHQRNFPVSVLNFSDDPTDDWPLVREVSTTLCGPLNLGRFNTSFSQQMHTVRADTPDLILATYRSAIPILAAVEGYYEELGLHMPAN